MGLPWDSTFLSFEANESIMRKYKNKIDKLTSSPSYKCIKIAGCIMQYRWKITHAKSKDA
jgi:hypothetical protein